MAVDVTYLNSNSITNIDTNFERTKEALEKALGREGDLPNHMETDLDMNGNDILNITTIDASNISLDGTPILEVGNIDIVAGIADEITTVSNNNGNITIVADNITDVSLVADNMDAVLSPYLGGVREDSGTFGTAPDGVVEVGTFTSILVWLNGFLLKEGAGADYTQDGTSFTVLSPTEGDEWAYLAYYNDGQLQGFVDDAEDARDTAVGAAEIAVAARDVTTAARDTTLTAKDAAVAASEAAGVDHWEDTYADAEAALSGYAEGDVVGVFTDETKSGATVWYRVEGGALVEKVTTIRVIRPEQFGAKGDGSADDTTAINAAVAAGERVHLRSGATYRTTDTIVLSSDGSGLIGDGTAVIQPDGDFKSIIVDGASDVELRGFKIRGDRSLYTDDGNDGVLVDWRSAAGANVLIENVTVEEVSGAGIIALASSGTPSSGFKVLSSRTKNTGAHGIIAQDYISDVIVKGNIVEASGLGTADRPGITASRFGQNVVIADNIVVGSTSALGTSCHGISVDEVVGATCTGNVVKGWVGFGIEVVFSDDVSVTGNTVRDCRYGICGSGSENLGKRNTNVVVSGNKITHIELVGLYFFISGATGVFFHENITIMGNDVSDCYGGTLGNGVSLQYIDGLTADIASSVNNSGFGVELLDCKSIILDAKRVTGNNLDGGLKQIDSLTASGSTATAVCVDHGYSSGDVVSIFGASPTEYNDDGVTITVLDDDTFTYGLVRSGLASPASGGAYCGKAKSTSKGGVRVHWSLVPLGERGNNRLGYINAYYNGFRDLYDIGLNGISGLVQDVLFLPDRPILPRVENLTSALSTDVKDRLGVFMKNGKMVIAYNNAGVINYLSIPLDGATSTWTQSATAP